MGQWVCGSAGVGRMDDLTLHEGKGMTQELEGRDGQCYLSGTFFRVCACGMAREGILLPTADIYLPSAAFPHLAALT